MKNLFVGEGLLIRFNEKNTKTGKRVANFTVVLSDQQNSNDDGTFVDVEAWNLTPQLSQVLSNNVKRCRVFLAGKLKLDKFQDRSGNERQKLKVVASRVQYVPFEQKTQRPQTQEVQPQEDNDIPF